MTDLTWKEQAEGPGARHNLSKPSGVWKRAISPNPHYLSLSQAPNIFFLQGKIRNSISCEIMLADVQWKILMHNGNTEETIKTQ